jgi:hypothetical protein
VPPIQHDCGVRQRLALQPPQPGIAVAQHGCRCVRCHARYPERLLERTRCNRGAVAREGEAGLNRVQFETDSRALGCVPHSSYMAIFP